MSLKEFLNRILFYVEAYGPYAWGGVVFLLLQYQGQEAADYLDTKNVNISSIYSNMLSLCSITTGFLATFFTTIYASNLRFIVRIRKSKYYARFIRYLKSAIRYGIVFSFISIPLTVLTPKIYETESVINFVAHFWFGFATLTMFCFWRVFKILFIIFDD